MPTESERTSLPELAPDSDFGPYRIVRLLGRGGMGAVYEAEHRSDGRVVALKLLSVDLDKMDARARFLREGLTAAAINHPNTVYIYGTEEIDGTPAISMELVPGGTLDEKVKSRGPLPWAEAVEDILQVIDGLDAALAAGVLHRDVKPSNCFVGANGAVKIGDFGLSKPVEHDEQLRLTQTGVFLGTPVFSSPEQLLGESLDVRSDIYAVGVTFYSLLTGSLPYPSGSMMQVVAAVLNGSPAPLAKHRSDLPAGVIAVVQKAMARKVEDRYQSYAEFRADVAALRAVEVAPATLWDRFRAWVVDGTVNLIVVSLMVGLAPSTSGQPVDWRRIVVSLVVALLVVGIPEGLRGASAGKWLVGIRVVGPLGGAPGLVRGFARVLLLALTDLATAGVQSVVVEPNRIAAVTLVSSLFFHGLFLLTARRRNGWRLLHDVLTGTRVVRPQASTAHRRSETRAVAAAPRMTGDERRIGSYVVLGASQDAGSVLHGWDEGMRRAVWIVPRSVGSAEIASARRTLSRLTRLRWVGGRRSGEEAWDAFEAPIGEPLRERLRRPVSWSAQQDWLEDIATELLAAEQDGTTPSVWSADALWVTPTDRLVFPEGADAHAAAESGLHGQRALVGGLLDRVAAASRRDTPPPRHATLALDEARVCTNPAALLSIVQATRGRVSTVTRFRRAGLMGATLAPLAVVSLIGWFSIRQAMTSDREGFMMAGVTSFVADSLPAAPDTVTANPTTRVRVNRALRLLGFIATPVRDTTTPIDTLRRQRRLAEVYLATVLRGRVRDSLRTSVFGNSTRDKQRRAAIMARNTVVDSAVARDARALVDSVWQGRIPGNSDTSALSLIPATVAVFSLFFASLAAMVIGLLVRRGPLLRGFQLEVVTADGALASRWRLLLRNLMSWPSLTASLAAVGLAQVVSAPVLAQTLVGCVVFTVVWWVSAMVVSWRTPSRGLAERISGTYLVLE